MISYFLPPPKPETPKQKLMETINFLENQGIDDTAFKLLNALASGLIWSEESDTTVRKLGQKIAQELYDFATQNAEYETTLTDPENPRNW